jgi:hypothetical protein
MRVAQATVSLARSKRSRHLSKALSAGLISAQAGKAFLSPQNLINLRRAALLPSDVPVKAPGPFFAHEHSFLIRARHRVNPIHGYGCTPVESKALQPLKLQVQKPLLIQATNRD